MSPHFTEDPLVAFLYELVRDHVSPGKIETVVENTPVTDVYRLTNGFLAQYIESVIARLLKKGEIRPVNELAQHRVIDQLQNGTTETVAKALADFIRRIIQDRFGMPSLEGPPCQIVVESKLGTGPRKIMIQFSGTFVIPDAS